MSSRIYLIDFVSGMESDSELNMESCGALPSKTVTTATGECDMVLRYEQRCAEAYDGYKREKGCVATTTAQRAVLRRLGGEDAVLDGAGYCCSRAHCWVR